LTAPNQVWVAYIIYIPTGKGGLYLAVVKDLYTCGIVSWLMDKRITQTLLLEALTVARQLSCLVQRQLSCLVDAEIFTTDLA